MKKLLSLLLMVLMLLGADCHVQERILRRVSRPRNQNHRIVQEQKQRNCA